MASSINYKDTLFEQARLTPIRGEPTFKTIHKIRNKIKANTKSFQFNLGGGEHGYIRLVLKNAQYALILNTPFVCQEHTGSTHHTGRHNFPRKLKHENCIHQGSAHFSWRDRSQ